MKKPCLELLITFAEEPTPDEVGHFVAMVERELDKSFAGNVEDVRAGIVYHESEEEDD